MSEAGATDRIIEADWIRSDALRRVVDALDPAGEGLVRAVGGCVRDSLLGQPVADVDLATKLTPDVAAQRLSEAGLGHVPTGLKHGTITALADGKPFEVTTLRRDVATDGRHADVEFASDWREDATRRDFTINALYADVRSGRVFDYVGGLEDLDPTIVRFIGEAADRIEEDHLRILRYFRFLARFPDGPVDERALDACQAAASSIKALSRERVATELLKMLESADPTRAISLMLERGIFEASLPETLNDADSRIDRLVERETAYGLSPSPLRRFAALCDTERCDAAASRLKFSRSQRRHLAAIKASSAISSAEARSLAYYHGPDAALDAALIFASDDELAAIAEELSGFAPPPLPVKGGELIAQGLTAGPLISKVLKRIERRWIAANFPDGEDLANIVREEVSSATSE